MQLPVTAAGDAQPRVLVVGVDPIARATFVERLADQVVAEAGDLESDEIGLDPVVDVAVWDLGPDPAAAEQQLEELTRSDIPVVVLIPDGTDARGAIAPGGRGVLGRDASPDALRAAVDGAMQGLLVLDPAYVELVPGASGLASDPGLPLEPLTPRELEVLELLATGCSNRQVADGLGMSPHTAKFHVNAILDKLDASSRTEAVVRAIQLGLVML